MARQLGPYTRKSLTTELDGRTREAAFMRGFRAELVKAIGGKPTFLQTTLIDRACVLRLRIAMLDRKMVQVTDATLHDNNHYIAWVNALRRMIAEIAKQSAVGDTPNLTGKDALARIYALMDTAEEDDDAA